MLRGGVLGDDEIFHRGTNSAGLFTSGLSIHLCGLGRRNVGLQGRVGVVHSWHGRGGRGFRRRRVLRHRRRHLRGDHLRDGRVGPVFAEVLVQLRGARVLGARLLTLLPPSGVGVRILVAEAEVHHHLVIGALALFALLIRIGSGRGAVRHGRGTFAREGPLVRRLSRCWIPEPRSDGIGCQFSPGDRTETTRREAKTPTRLEVTRTRDDAPTVPPRDARCDRRSVSPRSLSKLLTQPVARILVVIFSSAPTI